jgi:predicted P-loop ATPase
MRFSYDTFTDQVMCEIEDEAKLVPLTDDHYTLAWCGLERLGIRATRDGVKHLILLIANRNPVDSAQMWLESLPKWDGVPRVETFLHKYFKTEDSAYSRSVSQYIWSALAGRIIVPGCQADMVPVLVGDQGVRKTSGVKAIAPALDYFTEISLHDRDDDLSRKMRGTLVAEIGELRGLRGKESESIKAFITRTHEEWTPKYREFTVSFPRRFLFFGTTNEPEFLADSTGNRRWLPIQVNGFVDVDAIARDRDQLWAEGKELFAMHKIMYFDAEALVDHSDYEEQDPWRPSIERWIDDKASVIDGECRVTTNEVLTQALWVYESKLTKPHMDRVVRILKQLGFKRANRKTEGKQNAMYVKAKDTHL